VRAEFKVLSRKDWKAQPAKVTEIINTRVEKLSPRSQAVYLTVHHNANSPVQRRCSWIATIVESYMV
jgi:hypothetical protein